MNLETIISELGNFSPDQIKQITACCTPHSFQKNSKILKEGKVCSSIFFLTQGCCYQVQNLDGEETIKDLYTPGDTMLDFTSFLAQQPAFESIEGFSEGEYWSLSIQHIHGLIELSQVFLQLAKVIKPSAFRLEILENAKTPYEKYQCLIKQKPKIVQTFPLKMIASYLKITPETLSRVRAMG